VNNVLDDSAPQKTDLAFKQKKTRDKFSLMITIVHNLSVQSLGEVNNKTMYILQFNF
jgi:hypothetical protein